MNERREIEMSNCPYCGSHTLVLRSNRKEAVKVGRKRVDVEGLSSTYCETCEQEFTTPAQHDSNLALLNAAKSTLSPILPREIRIIRATLAITQDEAQKMFAGGKHAFSKYERGLVVPTIASARLMRLAVSVPGVAANLAQASGVEPRVQWDQLGNPQASSKPVDPISSSVTVEDVPADWPAIQMSIERMPGGWWPTLRTEVSKVLEATVAPESAPSFAVPPEHFGVFVEAGPSPKTFQREFQGNFYISLVPFEHTGDLHYAGQFQLSSEDEPMAIDGPLRQRARAARAPRSARKN